MNPPPQTTISPSQPFLDHLLSELRVDTFVCSKQKSESGYTLVPRTIDDYNFIFVRRGRAAWVIDSQTCEMQTGDLVLVPPNVGHHATSRTQRVTIGSIHVRATLPDGQDIFELLQAPRLRRVAAGTRLDSYLAAAMDEWDRPAPSATLRTMPAWGRLITLELLLHDAAAGLLRQRPLDPIVAATLDKLSGSIHEHVTLTELAKWAGYSPQHLNRSFRAALGTTPLKYLTTLRLQHAATLLAEDRLTISRIAATVGIDDGYYFSRLFRQHFGCSPSQYRSDAGSNSPSPDSANPLQRRHPLR